VRRDQNSPLAATNGFDRVVDAAGSSGKGPRVHVDLSSAIDRQRYVPGVAAGSAQFLKNIGDSVKWVKWPTLTRADRV